MKNLFLLNFIELLQKHFQSTFFLNSKLIFVSDDNHDEYYSFKEDVEFICDSSGHIKTIFFHQPDSVLAEFYLCKCDRTSIHNQFGIPDYTGEKCHIEFLGLKGAWDKYLFDQYSIHFEYFYEQDEVKMITLAKK